MKSGARAAAAFVAAGLAAAGWILIRPSEAPSPAVVLAAAETQGEPATIERDALDVASREPAEVGVFVVTKPAPPPARSPAEADAPAEAAVASLRATIEAEIFVKSSFDGHARALADELRSAVGDEAIPALERIAADEARAELDLIASATLLLPLVAGPETLPGPALAALRRAWIGHDVDPRRAWAAAAALGRFGDVLDRVAMLDLVLAGESESARSLVLRGLGAARGDEAALEFAREAASSDDRRRRDIAVIAILHVASADEAGLGEEARARCAEFLREEYLRAEEGEQTVRLVDALAILDPESVSESLLAVLAVAETSEADAQALASRLGAIPKAAAGLGALASDETVPDARRVYAAEALMRAEVELPPAARALLERLRDESPRTPLGRRALEVLERADGGLARGTWDPAPGSPHDR